MSRLGMILVLTNIVPLGGYLLYAHSLPDKSKEKWEPLAHHLAAVGDRAAEFAQVFGLAEAARIAGRLHDIGKCSAAYQNYIAQPAADGVQTSGPDHSTAGARVASTAYRGPLGRMLAFAIAGHHAGLADAENLKGRLTEAYRIEPHNGWEAECGVLPDIRALTPSRHSQPGVDKGFTAAFLTRMIFSCLVDADFLETERFYAEANGEIVSRGGHAGLHILRDRLCAYMERLQSSAKPTPVNILRKQVLDHAIAKAERSPGFFTMTVPTGGGKTLASLSFALEHAVRHGLRRVIYVIPFTSIIEQTAGIFRDALNTGGNSDNILEHHASFDWDQTRDLGNADSEGPNGVEKLRRAAENWDIPIVVTTAVQFFESLFAKRTSRCRKLHNIAGSVVVLDEAQMLPNHLLRPCMAAMDELQRNYGTSIVLCTATQPALRKCDEALINKKGKNLGLDIEAARELAPDPHRLYSEFKRVEVEYRADATMDAQIADRFTEQAQMLCIVNSRGHARALFETIRTLPGACHLTTLMCPRHRRARLEDIRARLAANAPVRLVATSLIEAGVDVDFPEVWRAAAGLDAIAQAAGRCNREGRLDRGRVVVFTPAEAKPPRELEAFWQAARPVLRACGGGSNADLLGLGAIHSYFRTLYWQKGDAALDAAEVNGRPGILAALRERADTFDFPFASIAEAFRMIDNPMEPVIVPWKADRDDNEAEAALNRIAGMERPLARDLRTLQQYTVSIPSKVRHGWLAAGVLRTVHPALGSGLLCLDDLSHYRADTGLEIADPQSRSAESNVI